METPVRLPTGESAKYGFGNELDVDHGHRVSGHQGGELAFNATILRFPDDKLSVAVLCNLTQGPSKRIAYHIAALFLTAISDESNQGINDVSRSALNWALLHKMKPVQIKADCYQPLGMRHRAQSR